jgi:hypothetical protein
VDPRIPSTLKQIDEAAKENAGIAELGAVNITVTNGDACDVGWDLVIDQGSPTNHRGKTAAVGDLVPGIHTLKLRIEARRVQLRLITGSQLARSILSAAISSEPHATYLGETQHDLGSHRLRFFHLLLPVTRMTSTSKS